MSCNVCSSHDLRTLYLKHKMTVMQCKNCDFVFIHPPPSKETQSKYYDDSFEKGSYKLYSTAENLKIKTSEKRFIAFSKYAKGGKLLDVGCATGFFLNLALKKNFETFGVELSEEAIKKANKEHKIFHGILEEAKYDDSFFDIVTMYDIIEHVLDPSNTIKEISRIMKKDGILAITTPDISSWHAKIMGKNWGLITPLEHLSYFSPKTITLLLEKNGFRVIDIRKNFKVFTLDYIVGQAEFFYPGLYKILNPLSKILSKNFRSKYRNFYIGEMYIIAKKI